MLLTLWLSGSEQTMRGVPPGDVSACMVNLCASRAGNPD
jgi:hypothetical protein